MALEQAKPYPKPVRVEKAAGVQMVTAALVIDLLLVAAFVGSLVAAVLPDKKTDFGSGEAASESVPS